MLFKKTRDAGFPAFFVPPSRSRGADEAQRRDATEGQEGGTGKMRFAEIRDYSRWDSHVSTLSKPLSELGPGCQGRLWDDLSQRNFLHFSTRK